MILTHAGIPGDSPGGAGWAMALNKLTAHVDALGQQWRQRRRRLPHGAVNRAFCTGRQRVLLEESGQACAFDGQPFGARVWPCPIRRATNRKAADRSSPGQNRTLPTENLLLHPQFLHTTQQT